jgi:hypothetical protein
MSDDKVEAALHGSTAADAVLRKWAADSGDMLALLDLLTKGEDPELIVAELRKALQETGQVPVGRGMCARCGRTYKVKRGVLVWHYGRGSGDRCPGAGEPPATVSFETVQLVTVQLELSHLRHLTLRRLPALTV